MPRDSFFQNRFGQTRDAFVALNHEQRGAAVRGAVADLNAFLEPARTISDRPAPERSRALATSLLSALRRIERHGAADEAAARSLEERIVTNDLLRAEADRDQNVYVGHLFKRVLTHATPDVIVQPGSPSEVAGVFAWARAESVPLTLRGAASTALGGAVPNDAGVTVDLTRLDTIEIDAARGACVVGAGARLRTIHQRLAERGLALAVYPSNLGGTLAGWFVTGGIGMNAFGRGVALDAVRVADVLLPSGEHLRFHADGRLDVPGERGATHTALPAEAAAGWFRARDREPITLADLAGSEGTLGVVLQLTVQVVPRTEVGAFLLAFERRDQAFAAIDWIARSSREGLFPKPANVKLVSGSHLHHVRRVWADEDARAWHRAPSALGEGGALPWTRIAGPAELGASTGPDAGHAGAYLFVDFIGLDAARAFAGALPHCPERPVVLGDESVRFAAERFRPMQTKRLGPGLLAAEVVLPLARVPAYVAAAERVTRNAGLELDAEIYVLADGRALVIAAFLADHRRGGIGVDLVVVAALVDLALRHGGRPYLLGRWQAGWFERALGAAAGHRRKARGGVDPHELVSRGVLTRLRLHGFLGALFDTTFVPGVAAVRGMLELPATAWLVRAARGLMNLTPGPAAGRGEPAAIGVTFRASPPADRAAASESILLPIAPGTTRNAEPAPAASGQPESRALHCVNCGECNTVCPIFQDSGIRLPQMLTHIGEGVRGGQPIDATGATLLDLCMRCGNCEEVCQAGIPHLPMYERMQAKANAAGLGDAERHTAIVASVRSSPRYRDDFLGLRGGMYLRRSPASLPGVARFVVIRSENDAGPAATCIHCGACVPVCPTHANREFEGLDPRSITTLQNRCIGCGTCVEVCPANLSNGGQTLRVMEAPAPDWFAALAEFDPSAVARTPAPAAEPIAAGAAVATTGDPS